MNMTQLEINNWIRAEFRIRIMRELGHGISIWYYNDLYKTGNRRMIFKVYNHNYSPMDASTSRLQRANAINNTLNCILNRMRTYKIQEGWEIVEEGGYIALVKYTKSPEFLKKQRAKKRAKECSNTIDGKFIEIEGIKYQLKRV